MNISKLIIFIFRNMTIFWDIPKWNRKQTNWDGGSNSHIKSFQNFQRIFLYISFILFNVSITHHICVFIM